MRFEGLSVLITGGSSGIGAACVKCFTERGAGISILDKISPAACGDAVITVGDITDPAVRRRAVDATLDRYGKIDILVNNVGVGMYKRVSASALADDLCLITTNALSAVAMAQLVIPHMRLRREGWIANISSVGAYAGLPWSAAYCASKSALHSYAESLRRELRGSGIHVSTIIPGIVDTEFRRHVLSGTAPAEVVKIRQMVSPDDVAACVVRSISRRRSRIFVPWYARIFAALDLLMPSVMDAYVARKWSPSEEVAPEHAPLPSTSKAHGDTRLRPT